MDRKRVRVDSEFQSNKRARIIYGENDRISQFPDEILLHIISFLPLKDAACTSVLSSRWLNLWEHTPSLVFDAHVSLQKIARGLDIYTVKRAKYVQWVNLIIQKHKAVALREFRICLNLSQSEREEIIRWLKFAFRRKVQSLELNFSPYNEYLSSESRFNFSSFPEGFFAQNSSQIELKSLKVLSLKCVRVTDEAIEFFLRSCTSLEKLVVDDTYQISNLEVCGPSLVLKHLELIRCHNLNSVKISAPNLTSLILPKVKELLLENVPKLVEVSVACRSDKVLVKNITSAISCCFFQLEVLTLKVTDHPQAIFPSTILELPKLKKLVVEISYLCGFKSLMGLITLIRASPYLQEFALKLMWWTPSLDRRVNDIIKFSHQHLKVFKFSGYYNHSNDVKLLKYIVENCVTLEKVIIDPRYAEIYHRVPQHPDESVKKQAVKDYVKQMLIGEVPEQIELVVL